MRANNGAYNPLDRLAMIRKNLFVGNMSLGQRPIPSTLSTSKTRCLLRHQWFL